jgi:CRISPR-associated endonuclease Cas1/CRISPR-associated protein Cas4
MDHQPEVRPKRLPLVPKEDLDEPLVPARMINEVLYCERLMYLEWIQGQWADNYFTADGRAVHSRADKPKPLTEPAIAEDGEPLPYTARSVWLSSQKLGITAKIDVVEVEGNRVVPIEYKRGKRPDVPEGAYLPERAQVCAQLLLLREHGFQCDYGEIYYAKDRQRVRISVDEALIALTSDAVTKIRTLADNGELPLPLRDSPKCHGCSLVGICLPDEVQVLNDIYPGLQPSIHDEEPSNDDEPDPWGFGPNPAKKPVRRLFPARDDRVPLYVQSQGAAIRLEGERFVVRCKDGAGAEARIANTSQVSIYGNVQVTTPVLRTLLDRNIPTLFFSYGGWYQGRLVAGDSKNVDLRLAQYQGVESELSCLRLAKGFVASKILNCRTMLRRNHASPPGVVLSELKQLAHKARNTSNLGSLLGIEGTAARAYFSEFTGMFKREGAEHFDFDGRNRRPPRDPVNAMLSFAYSILAKELLIAVTAVGLDPMLGFYHRPHFGRAGLALDLMEEFRPIIADSVVINSINTGVVQPDDFIRAAGSVNLATAARKRFILAFERRMDQLVTHPVFDYRISYRRVLEVQARLLTRYLLGEINFYPEFRVR